MFASFPNNFPSLISMARNRNDELPDSTTAAIPGEKSLPPRMVLTVLKGNEDNSLGVTKYAANNTDPIPLGVGEHIRFESPDYRTAEGMKAIAINNATGTVQTLLKSYDVNNEFFTKLEPGKYQLRVQATWLEFGTHIYIFNIVVS